MASCQTSRWVSTAPYVKLTVTQSSSTATQVTLSWKLQYISDYPASASSRNYTVKIAGATVKSGTYNIDGVTGTKTIASGTKTINKTHSAQTISFSVSFDMKLTWSGSYKGTVSASGSISVAKKTSYTVSYNANGGTGAPGNQTKWHGENLTLSSTVPTRSGYTFVGWSLNEVSTSWYYQPGSECGRNEPVSLYAVWRKTITLSYNANGGSNAPASRETTIFNATTSATFTVTGSPSRTGYKFLGWSTSASATSPSHVGGNTITLSSDTTLYAVWQLITYTVTYNANGGTNPPPAQTKTYGTDLVLSSSTPTRSGYNFKGWATSSDGSVTYNAGGVYSTNDNLSLYAVWERAIFTVSYNANGGSDAPASQQKVYGTDLTLTSAIPTRKYYTFKGWSESADGSVVYSAGGTYKTNVDITLYAVWEVAYIIPRITGVSVERCDKNGDSLDDGTYALVKFNWATDEDVSVIKIYWKTSTDAYYGNNIGVAATGRSGSVSEVVGGGALSEDLAYTFKIDVSDTTDFNSATQMLSATLFPIDMLAGGKGVTIGGPAKYEGFNVLMPAYFEQGFLNPVLEVGTDLNDVIEPNVYTSFLATGNAYANCPFTDGTFVLEVYSSGDSDQLLQRCSTCNKDDPQVYVRFYYSGAWGDWVYSNHVTRIHGMEDYVIEKGSHDFWVWRKWASGDAECWGIYWKPAADYTSDAVDTKWYFDGNSTNVPFPPNLFSTEPFSISANPIYNDASTHFGVAWMDKTQVSGWVNTVQKMTNKTVGISFYVKGWWK